MLTRRQALLAHLHFLHQPTRRFLPMLALFGLVLIVGGVCFHLLYAEQHLSFARSLYITYALVFMEHALPFPQHWLLQIFYVVLPPLGLVVLLDGFVRYGGHLLRRDAVSPEWNLAMSKTLHDHVILCGLGKAGLRTLEYLLRLGEQVAVLERDEHNINLAFARQRGVPVIVGSSRQAGILDQLNVGEARAIILATSDDLANLEMALDARRTKPGINVVLRLFDQELAAKVGESFNISMAVSTTALAAPLFATGATNPAVRSAFSVGERLLVVVRHTIAAGSRWQEADLAGFCEAHPVFVLTHERAGEETWRPVPATRLAVGDVLTVQGEAGVIAALGHEPQGDGV